VRWGADPGHLRSAWGSVMSFVGFHSHQ
jgi:hypothetical protein